MKNTYIILIALLFGSCCPKIIPQTTTTIITHDTIVKVIQRDTAIFIKGERVEIHDKVNCDSLNRAQMKKTTVKNGRESATVEIKNGNLIVECRTDSLKLLLKLKDKQINVLQKQLTTQVNNIEVYKLHWWQKVLIGIGLIYLFITLLWIGFVVLKHSVIP